MSFNNNRNNARPQGQGNRNQPQENIMVGIRTAKQALPYDFLPLDTSNTVSAEKVLHDGSSKKELYSGELRCEMTTLTPLLVGWKKHNDSEEGVLQPLLHPDDGRVLIPGTSIKGMIRQRIAMLTNAPMEKVAERTYSYRPNLDFGSKFIVRPAVIQAIDGTNITVAVLPSAKSATFIHDAPENIKKYMGLNPQELRFGKGVKGSFPNYTIGTYKKRGRDWVADQNASCKMIQKAGETLDLMHYFFKYKGGIDGIGHLAETFSPPKKVHYEAIVSKADWDKRTENIAIDSTVYQHYLETQQHLADEKVGHISNRHPLVDNANAGRIGRAIKEATDLEPNQLIYVEYDTVNKKVVSFGHHFHYRWRFADTVTTQLINGENILRPELTPVKDGLSTPLAMFGYTQDKDALAGRISINFAIEILQQEHKDDQGKAKASRFIDAGEGFALKPLGQPRPSAVEFYLKQQANATKLTTYGDLLPPSQAGKSDGGVLAGRKFYPHQTNTNAQHYKKQGTPETHNPRVRYVLPKDRKFRFTIRYKDLTDWEVGTLLLAIQPHLAKDGAKPEEYGLKLGYARPLGFGSVCIDAKQHHQFDAKDFSPISVENNDAFVKAIKGKVSNLDAWLGSAKLSAQLRNYPEKNGDIFAWHGDIRKKHAKQRRS